MNEERDLGCEIQETVNKGDTLVITRDAEGRWTIIWITPASGLTVTSHGATLQEAWDAEPV